jgi:hypothetical protein
MVYWIAGLSCFLIVSIFDNKIVQNIFYIFGCVLFALTNKYIYGEADLAWYRGVYDIISIYNVQYYIESNDYEALFFFIILLDVYTTQLGLHGVLFVILLFPIFLPSERKILPLIALYFLMPGTFLLVNNVIRQGLAELMLTTWVGRGGPMALGLAAVLFHRFSFLPFAYALIQKITSLPNITKGVLLSTSLSIYFIAMFFSADSVDAYSHLEFSWFNFLLKFVVCVVPLVPSAYFYIFRSVRKFNDVWAFKTTIYIIALAFLSVEISPRLADRIILFSLPFSLMVYYTNQYPIKWMRLSHFIIFGAAVGSLWLPSHIHFFI